MFTSNQTQGRFTANTAEGLHIHLPQVELDQAVNCSYFHCSAELEDGLHVMDQYQSLYCSLCCLEKQEARVQIPLNGVVVDVRYRH
ncbi:MAG: hypothetical protein KJ601_00145 [Nanoarchaeota archaeon]|nr:hypothetical protein [Nanoarchaeota archaeon]